jgi:KipI family sensor histidine kinase inhibitor
MRTRPPLLISDMGERAILCQVPAALLSLEIQEHFWALSEAASHMDGVVECVPGMNNLLVSFAAEAVARETLAAALARTWVNLESPSRVKKPVGQIIEIPVRYGGRDGEDLAGLAEAEGMSAEDFARLHAAGDYIVYALGSQPGFGYLGGLDPRLATPRRDVPRASVRAGAVVIGGQQSAVQSRTSPSGWHVIGQTEMQFFNPAQNPPTLLNPGDRVRFVIAKVFP